MTADIPQDAIELRVDKIAQLFHSLDPGSAISTRTPRITSSAGRASSIGISRLRVHVPDDKAQSEEAQDVREAFAHYFSYRAESLQRELKELFRVGRRSLVIGMTVLAACLLSAHFVVGHLFNPPFARLVEESLLILGWVLTPVRS
jgi:hypothetical protein